MEQAWSARCHAEIYGLLLCTSLERPFLSLVPPFRDFPAGPWFPPCLVLLSLKQAYYTLESAVWKARKASTWVSLLSALEQPASPRLQEEMGCCLHVLVMPRKTLKNQPKITNLEKYKIIKIGFRNLKNTSIKSQ